jgi:hypothetical protein
MDEFLITSGLPQLTAALKHALLHQSFDAGELLRKLINKKDYGDWKTFDNFVKGELGILPRKAYRLMFAFEMRELFKKHERLLPVSEGSVRPLDALRVDRQRATIKLTLEELQLAAWDLAVAMKQKSTPTETDVRRAVRQLITPKPDESTDKVFRAYSRHANRVRSEITKMTKLMRDLAAFLECADKKTKKQKKDMSNMLEKLIMSLNKHWLMFEGRWVPDQQLFEKGDYLAALSKAKRLERMVAILSAHDWCRRTPKSRKNSK